MVALGLDIGTTSICGVAIDSDSGVVKKVINRKNDFWLNGESWEKLQNPDGILERVYEILAELKCEDIEAIGVTGQMHGILYYNSDGKSVSPLYIWQDGRGNLKLDDKTYAEQLNSYTGYGNVTHFYNMKNGLVPEAAVGFCTIHDYVVMSLTGRKKALVHSSDGASFGCYDIKTNEFVWKNDMQPQVTDKTELAGMWNNIPVAVAIGDNQASFIGGGCDDDTLLLNVGTGSQISLMNTADKAPSGLEIRPLSDKKYIMVGSSLCGGRAYALLKDFFSKVASMLGTDVEDLYDKMSCEIKGMEQTDLSFKTLFCGTRENPDKRAEITGLSIDNFTPADMILACFNGITDELFEIYENTGRKCNRLVGTGNGIRQNPKLKSIMEERFNLKMQIPKFSEEAAVGTALFALVACGRYSDLNLAERIINYENI